MEISFKVLDLIKDVANDPEFQHDFNLTHLNDDQVFNVVLVDKKLLKVALQSNLNNYNHDIALETEWEDGDPEYLIPTRDELVGLINQL